MTFRSGTNYCRSLILSYSLKSFDSKISFKYDTGTTSEILPPVLSDIFALSIPINLNLLRTPSLTELSVTNGSGEINTGAPLYPVAQSSSNNMNFKFGFISGSSIVVIQLAISAFFERGLRISPTPRLKGNPKT